MKENVMLLIEDNPDDEKLTRRAFEKNKLAHFKGTQELTFRRTCGKVSIFATDTAPFAGQATVAHWTNPAPVEGV